MNAKPNFEALYNINPWVKSFAFITSQDFDNKLLMEYFLIIIDKDGKTDYVGESIYYTNDAINLLCPDGDHVECGLKEAKLRASIELMDRYSKFFSKTEGMEPFDQRWKLVNDIPKFEKASISLLASFLPMDAAVVQNVFKSQNKKLRDFLSKVAILGKNISFVPIPPRDK